MISSCGEKQHSSPFKGLWRCSSNLWTLSKSFSLCASTLPNARNNTKIQMKDGRENPNFSLFIGCSWIDQKSICIVYTVHSIKPFRRSTLYVQPCINLLINALPHTKLLVMFNERGKVLEETGERGCTFLKWDCGAEGGSCLFLLGRVGGPRAFKIAGNTLWNN